MEATIDRAVSHLRDGVEEAERISGVETADLAYIVEITRARVKVGGADGPATLALRVTTIFRREDGEWRIVHRHADPITTARPIESAFER